ncbi:MAG: Fe-S cluster assembly protein SufD [Candidatus Binatia bacterium]|nr:MAG: Fe-S cluster assembly protein SufD [Candidatus Binatia bacterium]
MKPRATVPMTQPLARDARFVPPAHGFALYEQLVRQLDAESPEWVRQLRARGMAVFRQLGFPTTRLEDWKYTDTRAIVATPFRLAPAPDRAATRVETVRASYDLPHAVTLAFSNGRAVATRDSVASLPAGVRLLSLRDAVVHEPFLVRNVLAQVAPIEDASFTALNMALLDDGAVLWVPAHTEVSLPIRLLFVTGDVPGPTITCPHNLIVLGEGASATVYEYWIGRSAEPVLANSVTEVLLDRGARLAHTRILVDEKETLHMGLTSVRQPRESRYVSQVFTFAGKWGRVETHTRLEGPDASTVLDGLFVANGSTFVDHHTAIDHVCERTTSRQLYKGVLDEAAHGVFNGKVFVRPGAFRSDAQQMNKNLLLSDDAEIDTKPQLEIFADDVKCSHGAAIGRLDDTALFYLRARGVAAEEARRLLIYAFANEIVERVPDDDVRRHLRQALRLRLAGAPEEEPW